MRAQSDQREPSPQALQDGLVEGVEVDVVLQLGEVMPRPLPAPRAAGTEWLLISSARRPAAAARR
eukprot:336688-Pyramimonas_sp.AAC.1